MPYPMTHLVIAQRLLAQLPVEDVPAFYMGSIAPDAYSRLKAEKSLHDRLAAHMIGEAGEDAEVTRKRIADFFRVKASGSEGDFRIGYALHLLVDLYWDESVVKPILRDAAPAENPYRVYAHDMGVLDVELYYRADAVRTIFPSLAAAEPMGLAPYVTPEQAAAERDITLPWYEKHSDLRSEQILGCMPLADLIAHVDYAQSAIAGCGFSMFDWHSAAE